jgi:hypothetical protein
VAESARKGRVIVVGCMFWYPLAGVTYQFLHYLIGLKRLGYDVWYIEDSSRWVYDPVTNEFSDDASRNVASVRQILEAHGFSERWAFHGNYPGGRSYGLSRERVAGLYAEADALLNVTGAQEMRDEHLRCRRRIYVESDPFAWQVRYVQDDRAAVEHLSAHNVHFTFGEHIGAADCGIPATPFTWHPTRQPVVLDLWKPIPPRAGAAYLTITTWHNKDREVTHNGETYYWTKDREFESFLGLPRRRDVSWELATTAPPSTEARLRDLGWELRNSVSISSDLQAYCDYIRNSRGEFTVARDQYVRPRTGWFSDRSACFLAAGRPVITQETGFSAHLPTGAGLFGFTSVDDVLAAVDAIESDYGHHCRAAEQIAREYFAAEKVLGSLMERAGS